jgi:DNA-binding transcriptional LysR family regulator
VADVVMVPLLPVLLGRHPALRVDIVPGEALVDLTRREADVALRTVRPVRGDLVVTRVMAVAWLPAASPKLARSLGALRAWTQAPWIGWGERSASVAPGRWLDDKLAGAEPVVRSDSLRVQLAAVTAGVGVGLVPAPSVAHFGLVPVKLGAALRPDAAELPSDDLFLVTHRALRDVPRVRAVWELLYERLTGRRPANQR